MPSSATLSQSPRPPAALSVLALHAALLLVLLQTDVLQRALPVAVPVAVMLLPAAQRAPIAAIAPIALTVPPRAAAAPEALAEPSLSTSPKVPPLAPPVVDLASALPQPAATSMAPTLRATDPPASPAVGARALPAPQAVDAAAGVAGAAPSPTPSVPAAPAAPMAEPRLLSPGAVGYSVPPAIAVPLASRRLRESGTVWLRVRVDRQGLPVQISLHRTSGYPRLDEQALAAMQAARFVPQTENGQAIECVVIAPLTYEID